MPAVPHNIKPMNEAVRSEPIAGADFQSVAITDPVRSIDGGAEGNRTLLRLIDSQMATPVALDPN